MSNNNEHRYNGMVINGFALIFFIAIIVPLLAVFTALYLIPAQQIFGGLLLAALIFIFFLGLSGYFIQQPNEARVLIFFGKYSGTVRKTGFYWVNPFQNRQKLSLRLRNMDIDPIKVNDKAGNPVLIGMVLVWKIEDTYRVSFDLDSQGQGIDASLNNFVRIQSDAALREVTGHYAYDNVGGKDDELTLRNGGAEINKMLENKINDRLSMVGAKVVEARINYLAYAPEIAAVMLRKQQAEAIISAREKIVEGAVSMVEMALHNLDSKAVVKMSDSQKAAMVANLLAILCADEPLTPTLNTTINS